MSGGSLDYVQNPIDDAARQIIARAAGRKDSVLLRAFGNHLLRIGQICHDIEWDFSGDSELKAKDHAEIKDAVGHGAVLAQAVADAREAHSNLGKILDGLTA